MTKQIEEINRLYERAYQNLEKNDLEQVGNFIQKLEKYDLINSKICLSCLYIDFGEVKKDE